MSSPHLDFSPFEAAVGASSVRSSQVDGYNPLALEPGHHPSHGLPVPRGFGHARGQWGAGHGELPPIP
ncbi:hypothetical protein E2562_008317 [Oryza meyeriana var. granulata]|uniref:Uncharacterized protein n=1 Tax=Oryza meyeriana var. granulata TaxID=110450 RepID=A0A6G1DGX3_9ORYZ|nr:hypothetical protein E2562_008317 [Oryza meyeriana var. granulata]